jgi:hypothetical protein
MTSKKLLRYLTATYTNDTDVQAEQFKEIRESVRAFAHTVEVLVKDKNFAGLKIVMLDFLEEQDGVGYDEDSGGTALLGDSDVLEVAARYLLRRGKDSETAAELMGIVFRKAQGTQTPSTTIE